MRVLVSFLWCPSEDYNPCCFSLLSTQLPKQLLKVLTAAVYKDKPSINLCKTHSCFAAPQIPALTSHRLGAVWENQKTKTSPSSREQVLLFAMNSNSHSPLDKNNQCSPTLKPIQEQSKQPHPNPEHGAGVCGSAGSKYLFLHFVVIQWEIWG